MIKKLESILGYQVGRLIGKGAFSEVFEATKENERVAVKLMKLSTPAEAELILAAIRYEFWVLKDLTHENIVRVKDFGQLDDGRIFLIEEFLDGVTLDVFCRGKDFKQCEPVFVGVLEGLKELARWHVVHGDIKPANILVIEEGCKFKAKILDFGLAHPTTRALTANQTVQAPLINGGTPATMAPEVIMHRPSDARSDLYSVGVTFYACLSGKNPFVKNTIEATTNAQLHDTPELIGLTRYDVNPSWMDLIHALLNKNPADRPATPAKALSLVKREGFILTPTAFVGRTLDIGAALRIELALKTKKKTALVVWGAPGIGVSRFLREVFYQIVTRHPEARDVLRLPGELAFDEALIVLVDRQAAPKNYLSTEITLEAFNKEELKEWLRLILNLGDVPQKFLDKIFELSKGHPASVWEIMTLLNEKNLLTDATGTVTRATLSLIDWDALFVKSQVLGGGDNFDSLLHEAKRLVRERKITESDPLWQKLTGLAEKGTALVRLTKRAQVLALQGESLIDRGKFNEAREALNAALEIFKNNPEHRVIEIRLKNFLAYILLRQGKTSEAVTEFEASLTQIKEKLSPDEASLVTNLELGFAYLQAKDFAKAVTRLKEELKTATPEAVMRIYYNLAQAFVGLNDLVSAEHYFKEVIVKARQNADAAFILRAQNGLGNLYGVAHRHDEASVAYREAIDVALAIGDFTSAAAASQNLGVLLSDLEKLDDAILALKNSLQYAAKIAVLYAFEKNLLCRSFVELGEVHLKKNQADIAKDYVGRAWHMAEGDDDLRDFRFWVLLARCRVWRLANEEILFKQDLAQLNFYADDDVKRKKILELKSPISNPADETKSNVPIVNELDLILRINRDLVGDMPLTDLLRKILGYAVELSRAELGVILTRDDRGSLKPALSLNAALNDDLSAISKSVAEKVLASGKSVTTLDAREDTVFNQMASVLALNLRSILGVPIAFRGRVLGVLYLSHRLRAAAFDDNTARTIEAFADQVGLALTNHELLTFYRDAQASLKEELETSRLDLKRVKEQIKTGLTQTPMVTESPVLLDLLQTVERIAESGISILINGETGTGKELLARYIHESSPRRSKPFIAINCGALPANLIESELFGHVRGAFTGADRDKIGLVEAANGGTLFLDEIGDLPLDLQVKFLRVLQEKEVVRVGERHGKAIDVRIVAASHRNLRVDLDVGDFREDLYYRLAGYEMTLPPLRARREDIPLLAEHFLKIYRDENKRKKPERFGGALLKLMEDYSWPGNIRELKNFVTTAAALCEKAIVSLESLPQYLLQRVTGDAPPVADAGLIKKAAGWYHAGLSWQDHENLVLASALIGFNYDVPRVAMSLGVGVATIYKWLRENRLRENETLWRKKILPYGEGVRLKDVRKDIFLRVATKFPGQPYKAARELGVAPMTFYKWAKV